MNSEVKKSMNIEVKKLWTNALRSGEYQQGKGRLKHDDKYCCLGVLCELHRQITGEGKWDIVADHYAYFSTNISILYATNYLPNFVMDWAGLSSNNPNAGNVKLSDYNDGVGIPIQNFATIANIIEEKL